MNAKQVAELAKLIRRKAGGSFFSCTFTKRSNGETRKMLCKLGTNRKPTGDRPYEPTDYDLLTVYDVNKRDYRTIPLDGILSLRIRGETFVTEGEY